MDNREALKSMLNNLINDKSEEATLDLHNYLTSKMRDLTGTSVSASALPEEPAIEAPEDTEMASDSLESDDAE